MGKINFTKEHQAQLDALVLDALYNNVTFKGAVGTALNVNDLFNTTTTKTIETLVKGMRKDVEKNDEEDRWGKSAYEQRVINQKKKSLETLDLVVGYRKFKEEQAEAAAELREKKLQLKGLKESIEKPEDKITKLEAEIAASEGLT